MKFHTFSLTTQKLLILSICCAAIGVSLILGTTIADNGFVNRYERVYSNGIIEISPVPFSDSTYSSSQSAFKDTLSKLPYGSNPSIPLDVLLTITDPDSVGITHAYIPVSTFGSTCGIIQSEIIVHNEEILIPNVESSVITTTTTNSSEMVRIGNLLPDTLYTYKIASRGCNKIASTYERSFITLPDPTMTERKTHRIISPLSPFADQTTSNSNGNISVTLYQPKSVGITHAYIPVSVNNAQCTSMKGYITANSHNGNLIDSKTILLNPRVKNIIRIGNLTPRTQYSYSATVIGCNTSSTSYEKEFTTLEDPSIVLDTSARYLPANTHKTYTSKAVVHAPQVIDIVPDSTPTNNTQVETQTFEPDYQNSQTIAINIPATVSEPEPYKDSQLDIEPFEDQPTTVIVKNNNIKLPQTPREWIALLLLLVGTIGIITSFVHKNKTNI